LKRDRVEKLSNRREDIERQGRFEFVRCYVLTRTCFSFQLNVADKKADNTNKLGACSLPPRCINEHGFFASLLDLREEKYFTHLDVDFCLV
jgi:hypothetical protein